MAAVGSALLFQVALNTYTAEQQDNTVSGQPFFSLFAFAWTSRKKEFGNLQVKR